MNLSLALAGELALWVAMLIAGWSVVVSGLAAVQPGGDLAESGARALGSAALLLLLAFAGLMVALLTHDLALVYVARHGDEGGPMLWRAAALWAGGEGALLTWALVHAVAASVALRSIDRHRDALPIVTAVLGTILLVLASALAWSANPFEQFVWVPAAGTGLAPWMRHPALLAQPPLMLVALACAAVPFAFVVRLGARVPVEVPVLLARSHGWLLAGWCAASGSLLLGMWWASDVAATHDQWMTGGAARALLLLWLALAVAVHIPRRSGVRLRAVAYGLPLVIGVMLPLVPIESVLDVAHAMEHAGAGRWLLVLVLGTAAALVASVARIGSPPTALEAHARPARVRSPRTSVGTLVSALGAVILGAALGAAALLRSDARALLAPGERIEIAAPLLGRWSVTHQGTSVQDLRDAGDVVVGRVLLVAVTLYRAGRERPIVLAPSIRQRVDAVGLPAGPATAAAVTRRIGVGELFVAIEEVAEGERVRLRVVATPFILLVWLGGALLVAGGVVRLAAERA